MAAMINLRILIMFCIEVSVLGQRSLASVIIIMIYFSNRKILDNVKFIVYPRNVIFYPSFDLEGYNLSHPARAYFEGEKTWPPLYLALLVKV